MTTRNLLSGRKLRAPRALLLDFGGVIVQTTNQPDWVARLSAHVHDLLVRAGAAGDLTAEMIGEDIKAGGVADSHWKNAMSRLFAPPELRYDQFWGDFVACDWPAPARKVVIENAEELCRVMGHMKQRRELRNGALDLLDAADAARVPVGIVSNALSGQVHRDFLTERGLLTRFAAEVHSDGVRVRKPNPEMILIAARRIGVDPADAWYVGDNFDRDVLCGVRAGVGGIVLMEAKDTYAMPYALRVKPDAIVGDPAQLLTLFRNAVGVPA